MQKTLILSHFLNEASILAIFYSSGLENKFTKTIFKKLN